MSQIGSPGSLWVPGGRGDAVRGQLVPMVCEKVRLGRRTFMYSSLENSDRDDGCSNNIPCIKSRQARISRSFWPSLLFPSRRSRQLTRRSATFHSNPSCSLKNSRNAGSSGRSASSLRGDGGGLSAGTRSECRLLGLCFERQIWASRPSTWRMPLRILEAS